MVPADEFSRKRLAGKVALITGATSGIGLASAAQLAAHGADLAIVHRTQASLAVASAVLDPLGVRVAPVLADLADGAAAQRIVDSTVAQLGSVDILINCAAISESSTFLDQTLEEWERVQAVNLRAPFLLTQAVGRRMIVQGHGGRIVNVSSSSAFRAELAPPAYVSSKGGLNALTRSAAGAFGEHDINVNAVVPGMTATPMVTASFGSDDVAIHRALSSGPLRNLLHRISQPEDIAAVIVFLCLPASRQITGQLIHASGGAVV